MSIEKQIIELSDKQQTLDCHQAQLWKTLIQLEHLHLNTNSDLSSKAVSSNQLKQSKICQIGKLIYWTMTLQLTERLSRRKIAQLISHSGLFDTGYYWQQNPEIKKSGEDPLGHYIDIGADQGAEPNPLFDTAYYLKNNPEVVTSEMNPLAHYLSIGTSQGKNPHPLFDTAYYLKNNPEVVTSGINPLAHYLSIGTSQGKTPHPLFDTAYYLKNNPEVVTAGINPLTHYLSIGTSQGKNPHPLFDTAYYLKNNPEVTTSGMNSLVHYLGTETSQGKNPHPLFDTFYYLKNNPEVITLGLNPLVHYVTRRKQDNDYPILFANNLPLVASELTSILSKTKILLPLLEEAKNVFFLEYEQPEVSVIVPVYNKLEYTLRCLKSLMYQATSTAFEVIIADDHSIDSTQEALSSIEGLKYIRNPENYGFLKSCNYASQAARGQYIVILNNDTIALKNWLEELISPFTTQEKVGLVGSMLLYPDGTLQEAGGLIWNDGSGWNFGRGQDPNICEYNFVRQTDYCSGASIALTTQLWRQLEGFDPLFSPAYYEDTDLAFRVRQSGYKVVYTPFSKIIHFEGISSGTDLNSGVKRYQLVNQPKFLKRWQDDLVKFPASPQSLRDVNYHRNICYKLLWIDATTPTPDQDSGSGDVFNFFQVIQQENWSTTFIPDNFCYDNKYTKSLQRMGVQCIYSPYWKSVQDYLRDNGKDFDVIVLSRVVIASKYIALLREYAPQAKIVFNTVDLHFLRQSRTVDVLDQLDSVDEVAKTFRDEILTISQSDLTIVVSPIEENLVRTIMPSAKLAIIPIIREIPGCENGFRNRQDIGFIGGFNHPPNVDAIHFFVSDIWPLVVSQLPTCRFIIAGSKIPDDIIDLASENVIVKGFVADLGDLFKNIRLSVAPLRFGAGMKGKVVSSLSYGVPVVATSLATEGMGVTSEREAIITDRPEQFAQAIVDVYTSQEKWSHLSNNGLRFSQDHFSIEAVSVKINEVFNELIDIDSKF
jgi:GT2 family glycosyltransferase